MKTKVKKYLLVVAMVLGVVISFGGNEVKASEKVDLNSATIEDLQKLEGVGAPLAQKIIDARPYKTVEELKEKVVGIGPAKLKAIQDQGLAVAESFPEKIDLNKASLYDLQFLVGVGEPLAQKLIDARPYKSVDELKDKVEGIGDIKLQAIKDQGLAFAEEELTPQTEKKISEWFPDPVLAKYIASVMKKDKNDIVTLYNLNRVEKYGQSPYDYAHFSGDISSLEGVQHLIKMEKVRIENTHVTDISCLTKLPNLYQVQLINNPKINLSPLGELVKPENILVMNTKNEDWSFLSKLTKTIGLRLEGCELEDKDIKNLDSLINLRSLGLANNKLTDISCLSELRNLESININSNEIKNIDVVVNYLKLSSLNADNNMIESISSDLSNKEIGYVRIRNNRLGDIDALTRFLKLQKDTYNTCGQQVTRLEPVKINKRKKMEVPINYQFTTQEAELIVDGEYDANKKITIITEKDLQKDDDSKNVFHYSAKNRPLNINIKIIQPVIFEADKSDLQELYDSVVNTEGRYSDDSWNKFQDELSKAKQLLEKENAIIEELDQTEKDLKEAFDALRIKLRDWFPDPALAKKVADKLKVTVDDEIFQNQLDGITSLNCQYSNLNDLTGLRYLKNLRSLSIYGNKGLEDISELSYCTDLSSLQAHECNISNIEALAKLKSLGAIRLDYNKITNIDALSSHPNISNLSINNNQITDISPINKLEKLQEIYLGHNKISNLSNVYWPIVRVISGAGNSINDISGLKDSNRLDTLTIGSGNEGVLKGVNCLANKEKLTILTLGASLSKEDLESISTLENLTRLSINESNAKDYSPLSSLTKLETLSVIRSGINNSNVETLKNVKTQSLNISYNNITNIDALNKLRSNIGSVIALAQTATVNGMLSSDGILSLKNPIKDIDGNFILPIINTSSMSYDDDVIRWRNATGNRQCSYSYLSPDKRINYNLTMTVTYTDKRELEKLIDSLKDTDKGNYTNKSWNDFQIALESAKKILEDTEASKETVEKGITELQKTFDMLTEKASSRDELKAFVDKVDKLYWSQDYSAGYLELTRACSNAKKVIENEDASQKEVDATLAELKQLEEQLVLKGNAAIPLDQRLTEARAKFLELINEERKAKGMNTLAYSDGLNSLADVRADEQQILYSHTRPNGSNVLYAGQRYGFTFLDECLTDSLFRDSRGYQKSGEDIGQTMFDSWKSSSAHYNIMVRTTRQTHIGLSFVVNNGNTFRMYGVLLVGWN